jgi:hypothetical protein
MKSLKWIVGAAMLTGMATTAQAISATYNDLILGFVCTSGTGAGMCLEVNLGSISNYYNKTGSWIVTNLNVSDLVSTYGASWSTNSNLSYGIAGSTDGITAGPDGELPRTIWVSEAQSTLGQQSTAWDPMSSQGIGVGKSRIVTMYSTADASLDVLTQASNASSAVADGSLPGSFQYQEWTPGGTKLSISYDLFNPSIESSVAVASESEYTSLDLYQLSSKFNNISSETVDYIGTFSLYGDGTLVFSSSPVPEPSTYAAIMGLCLGSLVIIRRKMTASKAA